MREHKYILDEQNNPVPEPDTLTWGRWNDNFKNRHVATTLLGNVKVSTVFLGLDHSWGEGPPLLWETMIFGGEHDEYQDRYTSLEAAKIGHTTAVALVRGPDPEGRKFKETI